MESHQAQANPENPALVNTPCEVCSGTEHRFLFSKDGYDFLRCASCRHLFNPIPLQDRELFQQYEDGFFVSGGYADYLADAKALRKNFERFIHLLRPHSPSGRLLEIGCSYGLFLSCAQRFWQVEGIDVSAKAVAYARQTLGTAAICGDFAELPYRQASYDAVVMWDTIEHLRHPARYLEKIARILKPNGVLALTTGDVESLAARLQGKSWRLYYPPLHLHYFSPRTLAALLERFGLKTIRITYVGYHRSLDMILHRLLNERKPPACQRIYRLAKRIGLASRRAVYFNLFDIMFAVARKLP